MEIAALIIGAIGGVGGMVSLISMFVLWGTYKEKVNRLEQDVNGLAKKMEDQRAAELEMLRRRQ